MSQSMKKEGPVTRFLVFCSGSSPDLLRQCPSSEWIKHTGIGMTVLLTSVLAMVSAAVALQSVFGTWWVSIAFSLLWAVLIFNLDRYIVSSFRKHANPLREMRQALPRLLLAVGIALVVAKPLEMEVFRTEIRQVLGDRLSERLSVLERAHADRMAALDVRAVGARKLLDAAGTRRDRLYAEYTCECDGTCGTGIRGRGTECRSKQLRYEASEREYVAEKERFEAESALLSKEKSEATRQYEQAMKRAREEFSFGFLARLNALNSLGTMASYALSLLLLLVEFSPVLAKLLGTEGPYDNLLRMSENEYRHQYMRSVYEQNLDMQMRRERQRRMPPYPMEAPMSDSISDTHRKYAELRRKLRTRLKND
jgi:hypothetical protein